MRVNSSEELLFLANRYLQEPLQNREIRMLLKKILELLNPGG